MTLTSRGADASRPLLLVLFSSVRHLFIQVCLWSALSAVGAIGSSLVSMFLLKGKMSLVETIGTCFAFSALTILTLISEFRMSRARVKLKCDVGRTLVTEMTRSLISRGSKDGEDVRSLFYSDIRKVTEFFRAFSTSVVPSLVSLILMTPTLYYLVGVPGIVGVVLSFAQIFVAAGFSRLLKPLRERARGQEDGLLASVDSWARNNRLIRWLGWEEVLEKEIETKVRAYLVAATKEHFVRCVTFGITYSWWMLAVASVLLSAQYLAEEVSTGSVFGALWLITLLFRSFTNLPFALMSWTAARVSIERFETIFSPEVSVNRREDRSGRIAAIHLHKVTVSGRRGPILDDITLSIDLGKKTAIIGEVGAGKSTLLRVIAGVLQPDSGEVLVEFEDGFVTPLAQALSSFFSDTVYLGQDVYIANGSLAFNVTLETNVNDTLLKKAIDFAELQTDIHQIGGVDAFVGDSGAGLSGGQKQRLGLARVAYSQRRVWLLDNPLSALDLRVSSAIKERLAEAQGLVIALHHIDDTPFIQEVIHLENGRVMPLLQIAC